MEITRKALMTALGKLDITVRDESNPFSTGNTGYFMGGRLYWKKGLRDRAFFLCPDKFRAFSLLQILLERPLISILSHENQFNVVMGQMAV
jgi:hypothetical protein